MIIQFLLFLCAILDPCGQCGVNADCRVIRHNAQCECRVGYTGSPQSYCYPIERSTPAPIVIPLAQPCNPSPCGRNAVCREVSGAGACECRHGMMGDPYVECKFECEIDSDCDTRKACTLNKCQEVCNGACGINALCTAERHVPVCTCPDGYIGNAFVRCYPKPEERQPPPVPIDPCYPSPCGPYSQCRNVGGSAICSCLATYIGSPPNCRPECVTSSECDLTKACVRQRCEDPCIGVCGANAICKVINHSKSAVQNHHPFNINYSRF